MRKTYWVYSLFCTDTFPGIRTRGIVIVLYQPIAMYNFRMVPALFLDRDGVIIENRAGYVRRLEDITFIPRAVDALVKIQAIPFKIVIVTNQSAIGRGIITTKIAEDINAKVQEHLLQLGGRVDAIYVCPHIPEDLCDCRKPHPGLILRAANELSIDLSHSFMIGDALDDVRAGQNAGIPNTILLLTGRGKEQILLPRPQDMKPFMVCDDLLTAVEQHQDHLFHPSFHST